MEDILQNADPGSEPGFDPESNRSAALSRRAALLRAGTMGAAAFGAGIFGDGEARADNFRHSSDPTAPLVPPFADNVMDIGAKGDGATDDTAAFQRALDGAGKKGGIVYVPAATYVLKGTLTVPPSVTLLGAGQAPPTTRFEGGTILRAFSGKGQENGTPFITVRSNAAVRGLTIFYPEQNDDVSPYPPTIQGSGDNCALIDLLLVNPYYAVDFGTFHCGRHWIKSVYMRALRRGIYVAECFDVGRIEDVHMWPFWNPLSPKLEAFTAEHGEAFVMARTDWEYMVNCFCIGFKTGFRFVASHSGPGNCTLTQCGSDTGPDSTSVLVEDSQHHAGISFVNSQFMGKRHVEIHPTNTGPVKFTSCGFWGMDGITGSMALLQGAGQVSFHGCHFITWAQAADAEAAAIVAENGGLSIASCDFMDEGKAQIRIGANVQAAVVMGNRLRGGAKVTNLAGDRTQMGLNATT